MNIKKDWSLWLAGMGQVFILYLIWNHHLIIGSEAGNFFYPYIKYQRRLDLGIALIALTIFIIYISKIEAFIKSSSEKKEFLLVLITYLIGLALECWIRSRYPFSMAAVIQDKSATGFYTAALQSSFSHILQEFSEFASQFPSAHVQANMPGKTLFFKILQMLLNFPSLIGFFIIATSNLTAIIIFYICKELFRDKLIAWSALLLCLFIPAKIQFQPILNTVSPVLIYFSLLLIILSTTKRLKVYSLIAGITLFFQFLFDPVPFGLGLIFLAILFRLCTGNSFKIKFCNIILFVTLGFCGAGILFYALTGFNLVDGFIYCLKDASHFNASMRPYSIWVIENLKEYVIGAGIASTTILLCSIFKLHKMNWKLPAEGNAGIILAFFVLTILILNFSGANRGEVTRLWIFLTPMQALLTAFFCTYNYGKNGFLSPLGASYLQASISINSIGFVLVS